ncbi:MAG: acyl-CoA/acyl-ACP dehydrogenase [Gammaproteobacteria bacterium]|nr:acyl-CoA/acyl-ACP dehydrogenase [Gammaproteobacteria bacterium]
MTKHKLPLSTDPSTHSTTAEAMAAAGDIQSANDIASLDTATRAADEKIAANKTGLVERLIYGPRPGLEELQSGAHLAHKLESKQSEIVEAALDCLTKGQAFSSDGKLSTELRKTVTEHKAYGYTVPMEFGGAGASYPELACVEESLAANGLGALAVEISGELTIGAGSILGYGDDQQKKTYLPMIVEGQLMGFALTEVGVGVNAKKIRAYVEEDDNGDYRLFATQDANKLWITNTTYGALLGLVARIGQAGKQIGLFILQLPDTDIDQEQGYEFRCEPSNVAAFTANYNSRLHFKNFPIPKQNRIPADGVEVLFYCLRMGRCMLAAMSAGYQRMLACDASHYAIQRLGVGGPIIKHELPRFALGRILGGSLQARSLAYLALKQDEDGVDLAGLRDLTKTAAATAGVESMLAAEHVLGGRSFHAGSRVNEARANLHLFGIVEGEDDMIRMAMVRDVSLHFVEKYLAPLLSAIQSSNTGVEDKHRILRLTAATVIRYPLRSVTIITKLLLSKQFWQLGGWTLANVGLELIRLPLHLIPSACLPRYRVLPKPLRRYARFAEQRLRKIRWTYLGLSLFYQLKLTRAQIPLQRLGLQIEHLVSMLVLCHHAAVNDDSQQEVALLQAQLLKDKYDGIKLLSSLAELRRTQRMVETIGKRIENGRSSMLNDIKAEPFPHPWDKDE